MARQRIGARRHFATFEKHNGTQEPGSGQPTYSVDTDWDSVITGWPCELLTTGGGELIRGRQVTSQTTHVLIGEWYGAKTVTTEMRAKVNGTTLDIVAVYDPDGDQREQRIELKREQ